MNIAERIDFWSDYFFLHIYIEYIFKNKYILFGIIFSSVTLTFHLRLTKYLCLSSMTALTMIVTRHVSRRSKCFKQMHKYKRRRENAGIFAKTSSFNLSNSVHKLCTKILYQCGTWKECILTICLPCTETIIWCNIVNIVRKFQSSGGARLYCTTTCI